MSALARRSRTLTLAAVVGVLLVGCTAGGDTEPTPAPTGGAGAPTGGPVVIGTETLEPIVEATVPVPGTAEDDEVTVGLVSLVASGQTTELRVLLTPSFTSETENISIYDMFGHDVLPRLWDIGNMREYHVLSDTGMDFETEVVFALTTNGEPVLYQAFFPFPQDRPETVDVVLHPSWPVIEDVPVTYED